MILGWGVLSAWLCTGIVDLGKHREINPFEVVPSSRIVRLKEPRASTLHYDGLVIEYEACTRLRVIMRSMKLCTVEKPTARI